MKSNRASAQGFTLIEVMIVTAIIAILASIAYPSYQDSVKKSRRSDAMAALQGLAQAMERTYTEKGSYAWAGSTTGTNVASSVKPLVFAEKSPVDGSERYYDLRIITANQNSYTIQALPINAQKDDGAIQLKSTGERAWDRDGTGLAAASNACWNRSC